MIIIIIIIISLGWEGNRMSGVAVAHASQTIVLQPPTGSTSYVKEMSTLPMLLGKKK